MLEGLVLAAVLLLGRAEAEEEFLPLRSAVGVPSTFSRGGESVEEIARKAVDRGIDVLVLGDDYLQRFDYGVPFLRRLVRFGHQERSPMTEGDLEAYLDEIRRVDALFPELIVIDGMAVTPFYYWDADWGRRQLKLRGWDRRLLVVGLGDAGAYSRLPVMGSAELEIWHWTGLLSAWPLLGLLYGWVARRRHPVVLRYAIAGISAICLIGNFPFKVALWNAHSGGLGLAPHQYFIDSQAEGEGAVFWLPPGKGAAPESVKILDGRMDLLPLPSRRAGEIAHTNGYTGFAALRGEERIAVEPGGEWDRALGQFLRGERRRPVWGMGHVDAERGDGSADVQTVLLVRERSRQEVIEALRSGRMYAVKEGEGWLAIDNFRVTTQGEWGMAGEEILSRGRPRISARIASTSGGEGVVRVQLIKAGAVVARMRGETPLELNHIDTVVPPGEKVYYRLMVRGAGGELISNPIFVTGAEL